MTSCSPLLFFSLYSLLWLLVPLYSSSLCISCFSDFLFPLLFFFLYSLLLSTSCSLLLFLIFEFSTALTSCSPLLFLSLYSLLWLLVPLYSSSLCIPCSDFLFPSALLLFVFPSALDFLFLATVLHLCIPYCSDFLVLSTLLLFVFPALTSFPLYSSYLCIPCSDFLFPSTLLLFELPALTTCSPLLSFSFKSLLLWLLVPLTCSLFVFRAAMTTCSPLLFSLCIPCCSDFLFPSTLLLFVFPVLLLLVPLYCSSFLTFDDTGLCSAVGNVSGYRCVSDCRSRGREFDPGLVPYFRGDWSWNNFYGHSPPFRWFIQEGLLSVTSEGMCTNYWLTACSSLLRKKCG